MRNLHIKIRKCVPTKWRNKWRISKAPSHHQTFQRNTEILFTNDACFPFTIPMFLMWSFASGLGHFETESRFWHMLYASIASMILHSARFLCVLYTEICIHATTGTSHVNVKGLINSDFLGQDQVSLDKKPNLLQSFHDFSTAHCQLSFSLPLSMKRNPKIIPRRWQTKKAQLGDSWGIQRETISPVKLQGWRYLGFWYLECTRKALVF